jgi:hypothetical protein
MKITLNNFGRKPPAATIIAILISAAGNPRKRQNGESQVGCYDILLKFSYKAAVHHCAVWMMISEKQRCEHRGNR